MRALCGSAGKQLPTGRALIDRCRALFSSAAGSFCAHFQQQGRCLVLCLCGYPRFMAAAEVATAKVGAHLVATLLKILDMSEIDPLATLAAGRHLE